MSSIQRTLLALLGLFAAAGVGYLVLWTGGGADENSAGGLELDRSVARGRARDMQDAPASLVAAGGRHAVLTGSGTVVDVRTMNGLGRRVPRAQIRLSNADGEAWTGGEAARFEDVTPGAWTLEVTARSMLTHTQEIEVVEGQVHHYTVKLRKHLPITGTVRNRFGEPPGNTIIWFLRPGESHPMERPGARKLLETQVTAAGDFEIDLPKAGEYRISVGGIGNPMGTMSELRELHAGGSQEVEIIVSGGTRLEIQLEDAPAAMAAGKTYFRVAIVGRSFQAGGRGSRGRFLTAGPESRQVGSRRGKRPARSDGENTGGENTGGENTGGEGDARRPERGAARGAGPGPNGTQQSGTQQSGTQQSGTQQSGTKQSGTKQSGTKQNEETSEAAGNPAQVGGSQGARGDDAWMDRVTRNVPTDGRLFFDGLPAEEELKLAFMRRNDRHVSINPIILQEGRHVVARFRVPDRIPRERAGEVQELSVMLETLPLPANAPPAGFYWK